MDDLHNNTKKHTDRHRCDR